jgi:hypothetical protein
VQGRQSPLRARARKRLRTNSARSAPTYNLANRRCCWRGREIRGSRQTHFSCRPHTSHRKSHNCTFWAHCRSSDGGSIGQRVCGSDGCGASDVLVVRCVRHQAQIHGEQGLRFDIRRRKLPWLWQLDGEGPVTPIVLVEVHEVALLSAYPPAQQRQYTPPIRANCQLSTVMLRCSCRDTCADAYAHKNCRVLRPTMSLRRLLAT